METVEDGLENTAPEDIVLGHGISEVQNAAGVDTESFGWHIRTLPCARRVLLATSLQTVILRLTEVLGSLVGHVIEDASIRLNEWHQVFDASESSNTGQLLRRVFVLRAEE